MKKLMIVMMIVIDLGLGFVHAEEMQVDFDGIGINRMNFMEAIKNADSGQNDKITHEQLKPMVVSSGNMEMTVFGLRMLTAMDESIKNAISYSAAHNNQLVRKNLEQLLKTGAFEQKYKFVYGSEKVYRFLDNLTGKGMAQMPDGMNTEIINSSRIYMEYKCVEYAYDRVCVDKMVCKYACVLMGGAAAVYGSVNGVWQIIIPAQIATEVCKDICANVPICVDTPRCVKYAPK